MGNLSQLAAKGKKASVNFYPDTLTPVIKGHTMVVRGIKFRDSCSTAAESPFLEESTPASAVLLDQLEDPDPALLLRCGCG